MLPGSRSTWGTDGSGPGGPARAPVRCSVRRDRAATMRDYRRAGPGAPVCLAHFASRTHTERRPRFLTKSPEWTPMTDRRGEGARIRLLARPGPGAPRPCSVRPRRRAGSLRQRCARARCRKLAREAGRACGFRPLIACGSPDRQGLSPPVPGRSRCSTRTSSSRRHVRGKRGLMVGCVAYAARRTRCSTPRRHLQTQSAAAALYRATRMRSVSLRA